MLRRSLFPFLLLGLAVPAGAQTDALGVFGFWGTFAEKARCYAISEPQRTARNNPRGALASVGWWPRTGQRGQIHFRLSQPKRRGSAILLRIDERTFQLVGGGQNAWAPDARADAEIIAAMRSGLEMRVETRNTRGGLMRESFALRGAATALDAAAIACAPKR